MNDFSQASRPIMDLSGLGGSLGGSATGGMMEGSPIANEIAQNNTRLATIA